MRDSKNREEEKDNLSSFVRRQLVVGSVASDYDYDYDCALSSQSLYLSRRCRQALERDPPTNLVVEKPAHSL